MPKIQLEILIGEARWRKIPKLAARLKKAAGFFGGRLGGQCRVGVVHKAAQNLAGLGLLRLRHCVGVRQAEPSHNLLFQCLHPNGLGAGNMIIAEKV